MLEVCVTLIAQPPRRRYRDRLSSIACARLLQRGRQKRAKTMIDLKAEFPAPVSAESMTIMRAKVVCKSNSG